MKLLGRTENKTTEDNGENVPHFENYRNIISSLQHCQ